MQSPMVFQNQIPLRVFYTQLGVQGMESICELRHYFSPLLSQCGPSHVLVFIVTINSNLVQYLLQTVIQKKNRKDTIENTNIT
jgi:hypothetical protein